MGKSRNTEQEILDAARGVFQEKGYKGATMRDIANKANINMAMLHYYFRSKDNLFYLIFDEAFRLLYGKIMHDVINDKIDIFEKIRTIIGEYISFFDSNPHIPPFITGEIIRNPEKIGERIRSVITPAVTFKMFTAQLEKEIEKGTIRAMSTLSLIINIISLCIFPAIAKPLILEILSGDDATEKMNLFESRKSEVADFIIRAIKT